VANEEPLKTIIDTHIPLISNEIRVTKEVINQMDKNKGKT